MFLLELHGPLVVGGIASGPKALVAFRQHYRNPEPTNRPASQICGRAVPVRSWSSRTL